MSTELQAPGAQSTTEGPAAPVSSNGFLGRNDELIGEIRSLLRDQLEADDSPDPRQAVDALLRELIITKRHDLLVQAAREGLIQYAWDFQKRNPINSPRGRQPSQSGKWDDVAEAVREHRDIFEVTVWVGTARKFLGDCSKADLASAAGYREKQASTMLDNADRMKKLARKLKSGQVVRDLDRAVVEGVFNA